MLKEKCYKSIVPPAIIYRVKCQLTTRGYTHKMSIAEMREIRQMHGKNS